MPLYEYECPTHGRYEVSQRITDAPLTKCSVGACDAPVRKLISTTSFTLKGSGWYATDYSRSSGAGEASSSGGACSTGSCPAFE